MASFFSATDVVGAAVEIERRGRDVYLKAASKCGDAGVKEFLEFFAAEEARHLTIFEKMAGRVGPVEVPPPGSPSEYMEYLRDLLDQHALFAGEGPDRLLAAATDMTSAIELAIRIEKDTILFFREMQELIPPAERAAVRECIEEERSHFRQLSDMLVRLGKPS